MCWIYHNLCIIPRDVWFCKKKKKYCRPGGGSTCGQRSVRFSPTRLWNRPPRPSHGILDVTCCTVVIVVALFDMSKQCQNPIQNVLVSRPYLSFVCVCECTYVLAYISVKAFSLLFWQRNRNIWLASLAPHWFSLSAIWHILFSVHSCLMQLSEPENLGSMTGAPRRQADRQTYAYILLLPTYLPHFRLHFYVNPVSEFSFSGFFLHIPNVFPLAFLPHKDFEAH